MAHFAKISDDNIVEHVIVIDDEFENDGSSYIKNILNLDGKWIQCSYNSNGGVHYLEDKITPSGKDHLRYNYPSEGYFYDEDNDAFIPPKPEGMDSWTLNNKSFLWEPPISYPEDGNEYEWDEKSISWIQRPHDFITKEEIKALLEKYSS